MIRAASLWGIKDEMMYRYLTLNDGTEVVHSDVLPDGRVKVFFERPDAKDGLISGSKAPIS